MKVINRTDPHMLSIVDAKLTNFVRLPLSVCKGTEAQRYQKAQEYSDKLTVRLDEISDKKSCSTADFVEALKSFLEPNKININIKSEVEKGSTATLGREVNYNKNYKLADGNIFENINADVVGYDINLKLNKDKTTIPDKSNALHEARHLFDYIFNPKCIQFRSFKFMFNDEKLKNYKKTYDLLVNDYLPFRTIKSIKKEVRSNLSEMSNQDGIDTLQSIRRGIQTEKNAYSDGERYMKSHTRRYWFDILAFKNYEKVMRFDKKLEFVNELLTEKLKAERDILKEKFSK